MKIFKKCPGEKNGYAECTRCPRIMYCVLKKIKRKIKRGIKKYLKIVFIVLILTIFIFIRTSWQCGENDSISKNQIAVMATPTTTPLAIKKATNCSKPTSTPKIKRKLGKNKMKIKISINLSREEKKMMEKVVYAEARGECFKGQVAVASVIINRYIFNKGKISIKNIINSKNQFADISNITQEMLNEYPSCKKAVKKALKGYDPTRVKFKHGARYFYEPNLVSEHQKKIREGIEVCIIGNHYFHNDFNE